MTLELLQNKESFISKLEYLGVAITGAKALPFPRQYLDLEQFFLDATNELTSSRITEGFLCWVIQYGHLLSPSKTRNLIKHGARYQPSVLGGLLDFMKDHKINTLQWKIIRKYCKKSKIELHLADAGPRPKVRTPNPNFLRYNVIIPNFKFDADKFLRRKDWILKNCVELRNRSLFGSVVHSDIASFLHYLPKATPYQIAKLTGHHKARVFKSFQDVRDSLLAAA